MPTFLPLPVPGHRFRPSARLRKGLWGLALAVAPPLALAQEPALQQGESRWGIGVGLDVQRDAYRGTDNHHQGIPLLYFENRWVRVLGPGIDLKLTSQGPVSFRLKARYALDGYEASDSPHLAGMAERKGGVWVGGEATWHTPLLDLHAELAGDASGHSHGRQFRLQADRQFRQGRFSITPRLAAIRLDQDYVSYYYGVAAAEARPGRAQYGGDATTNVEVGLRIDYALSPQHNLFLDLRATRLGDGIRDSPLVDRSRLGGLRVGYLYRF